VKKLRSLYCIIWFFGFQGLTFGNALHVVQGVALDVSVDRISPVSRVEGVALVEPPKVEAGPKSELLSLPEPPPPAPPIEEVVLLPEPPPRVVEKAVDLPVASESPSGEVASANMVTENVASLEVEEAGSSFPADTVEIEQAELPAPTPVVVLSGEIVGVEASQEDSGKPSSQEIMSRVSFSGSSTSVGSAPTEEKPILGIEERESGLLVTREGSVINESPNGLGDYMTNLMKKSPTVLPALPVNGKAPAVPQVERELSGWDPVPPSLPAESPNGPMPAKEFAGVQLREGTSFTPPPPAAPVSSDSEELSSLEEVIFPEAQNPASEISGMYPLVEGATY